MGEHLEATVFETQPDCSAKICGASDLALALTQAALKLRQTEAFIRAAACALSQSVLRVERLFASMRALHPAFRARTHLWRRDTDHVHTVEWPHGLENRPGYYDSPDHFVHRTGTELRVQRPGETGEHTCDLYETLRAQGYTDYLIVPLHFVDGTINVFRRANIPRRLTVTGGIHALRGIAEPLEMFSLA